MKYAAEISRTNPACMLFLIDQSGSMADPIGGSAEGQKKADIAADSLNRLLHNLVLKCSKGEGIRDYFYVGVVGYGGSKTEPALSGALAGHDLVLVSEVASNPARLENRTRKVPDGAGGLVEQTVRFPIWFDPIADGGTPMRQALSKACDVVGSWVSRFQNSFPPVVVNVTDGESTDGDPTEAAKTLTSSGTADGPTLLFNLHLSSQRKPAVEFPSSDANPRPVRQDALQHVEPWPSPRKMDTELTVGLVVRPFITRPGIRTPERSDGGRGCRTPPGTRRSPPAPGRGWRTPRPVRSRTSGARRRLSTGALSQHWPTPLMLHTIPSDASTRW